MSDKTIKDEKLDKVSGGWEAPVNPAPAPTPGRHEPLPPITPTPIPHGARPD